jgi:hypothetical protein
MLQSDRVQIIQTNFQHFSDVSLVIKFFDSFDFDQLFYSLFRNHLAVKHTRPLNMTSEMSERKSSKFMYLTPLSHATITHFHSFYGLHQAVIEVNIF